MMHSWYINQIVIVRNIVCHSTGLVYVRQHIDQMAEVEVEQVGQHSSDEEHFFSSMKSKRSEGKGELEGYLACIPNNMDLLNSFPNIKKL